LALRREAKCTPAETQQLPQLYAQSAEAAEASDLAQDFTTLVRQRQPERLDAWLPRATTSTLEALQRFATGRYEDSQAVKAGVTLPWSSGPVEGHINRLKMLKRQMFGRARLDRPAAASCWRPERAGPRLSAHVHRHRCTPRPRSHARR
jgi:transposase